MQQKLIFDLGMHLAQDTGYYLSLGYTVVAVDASVQMINLAKEKYTKEVHSGQLKLLNYAMSDQDGQQLEFYLSEKSEWNSLNFKISNRQGHQSEKVIVSTIKLSSIVKEYGVPQYCKIDVEGFDHICIKSLSEVHEIPKYISCETECFSENQTVTEEMILETLYSLYNVGYRKFKLIDQETLKPLLPGKPFYNKQINKPFFIFRLFNKLLRPLNYMITKIDNRQILSDKYKYQFSFGSTGPFGEDISGIWMDFETAKNCILFHREMFFKQETKVPLYTLWCDWHATY